MECCCHIQLFGIFLPRLLSWPVSLMHRFLLRSHVARGRRAERRAERYLGRQGLATVARNYARTTGEVDLIMLDAEQLVFVEVRYRGPGAWSRPLESVDRAKQRRIARTCELFRRDHPEHRFRSVRFDVVAATRGNYGVELEWIRNAFDATECT